MSEMFRENVRLAYSVTFLRSLKKKKTFYGMVKQHPLPWQTNQQINREFVGISAYIQAPSQKCIFIRHYLCFVEESPGFVNIRK